MNIVAVCGNYRKGGVTERLMEAAVEGARKAGATVDVLTLRDISFGFCRNCRSCWSSSQDKLLGECPIRDDLSAWIERVAAADGLILASPVNFGTLTALFKKFQERCLVLTRLNPLPPVFRKITGVPATPVPRHNGKPRPMICITASGAPAWIGRIAMPCARKQFEALAGAWPGRLSDFIWAGGSMTDSYVLAPSLPARARAAGARMAAGS